MPEKMQENLQEFSISLTEPTAANYRPGETIQGKLHMVLKQQLKMKEIRVEFHGGAEVRWPGPDQTHSRTETYFSARTTLYDAASYLDHPDHHLAGTYDYPFTFELPDGLPSSSFDAKFGNVFYFVRGVIDRSNPFLQIWGDSSFTVLGHYDLNTFPYLKNPTETHNERTSFCCLSCASGPITVTLKLARQGYVPGETILVNAEVVNRSRRDINGSKIILSQHIASHGHRETKFENKLLAEFRGGKIRPGGSEVYTNEPIIIPPALPPSELLGCGIIDISYYIWLVIDPSGKNLDLTTSLPVVLGTIPLNNIQSISDEPSPAPAPSAAECPSFLW